MRFRKHEGSYTLGKFQNHEITFAKPKMAFRLLKQIL